MIKSPSQNPLAMELRPLGFGEIFDRAVTLYVRNFVPFVAIVLVLVLPLAIMGYFVALGSQPEYDWMIRVFQHPSRTGTTVPTFFDTPGSIALIAATGLLSYVVWPFVMNAVAVGVARLYRGRPVEFRACYEVVLRRWPQILGLTGISILAVFGWYTVVVIVAVGIVFAGIALGAAVPALAFVFGFIAVLFVFSLMLPLLAPLLVSLAFAMYAAVIEERDVIPSLLLGFSRVFNRAEFWRALFFSLAAGAIVFAGSTMFSLLGMAAALMHLPGLEAVVQAFPSAVISPFSVVLLAVYYFDVRIRREAFDLETSLERLAAAQPA